MSDHPAFRYGMPSSGETLRYYKNFVIDFDARTRNPRWVLERIDPSTTTSTTNSNNTATGYNGGGADRSNSSFYEDPSL